ncbi:MAG: aldehyde dehydrogenase family protein [Pseudomonadota bacterium]
MDLLDSLGLKVLNSGACFGPNAWATADSSTAFASINPTTDKPISMVGPATAVDYEQIVSLSHQAFLRWRKVPAPKRGELVRRLGELLRANKDALGSLVSMEVGKIKQEGDGEVQEMIDMADFAVGQSRMLYGLSMHSERPQHRMYEQWHPLGPVGVITAFNFPVAVWAWNAFLAAICGDTVIWKPSPKAPLTAIAVQHLANQVMHEFDQPGLFTLFIPKDDAITERFVADSRVPLVSFTGSSVVGRRVAAKVAERMGRVLLECSGNNAIIVDETADLKIAIPAIVFGAVGTAGQRCTSTRRLIVHRSRMDDVVLKLKAAYSQVKIGDPLEAGTLMGPLIDQAAVKRFEDAVAAAQTSGGEIICGGQVIGRSGSFVEPTIIRAENAWPVTQNETFAPILYVMPYDTLDDAIRLQNEVPQGLSSAIFTRDVLSAEEFLSQTGSDCGIANVNVGTSGAEIGGAFGGEKETGGGREAGSDAWKAYMRRQTTTINWSREVALAQGIRFDLG